MILRTIPLASLALTIFLPSIVDSQASAPPPRLVREQAPLEPDFSELRRHVDAPASGTGALVDWDGDGFPDLLQGSHLIGSPWELVIRRNDGQAGFETVWTGIASDYSPYAIVGDVDGDGDPDAVLPDYYHVSQILENVGSGFEFERRDAPGIPWNLLALVDVDGDGDLDALASASGGLSLVRNAGDGSFGPTSEFIPGVAANSHGVEIADFNGDGILDLATRGDQCGVLFGDGTGAFPTVLDLQHPMYSYYGETAGDIDGDGDVDLIFTGYRPVHLNDGTGGFVEAPDRLPREIDGAVLRLADVDLDGDLDLIVKDGLFLNDGSGWFTERIEDYPGAVPTWGSSGIWVDDLDRDGDPDILLEGDNRIFLGDGTGAFLDTDVRVAETRRASRQVLGDVDGDGDVDAIVDTWLPDYTVEPLLLRNDGRGVFVHDADALTYASNGSRRAPRLADLDRDGDLDFLRGGREIRWNDGAGNFIRADVACEPLPIDDGGSVHDAELADFDRDGDLDLFHARCEFVSGGAGSSGAYREIRDVLWRNDGQGCFSEDPGALATAGKTRAFGAAVGDVDGDGDLDVVTTHPQLLLNDGTGIFTPAPDPLGEVEDSSDVQLVDLDGDGDLDAYFARMGADYPLDPDDGDIILWNEGGTFAVAEESAAKSYEIRFGDLDGDGDPDLASIYHRVQAPMPIPGFLQLYRNDGTGSFTRLDTPSVVQDHADLADLDLDGDLDVFCEGRAIMNLRRSLSWRRRARLDHPLTLDLTGTPYRRFHLFAAMNLAPWPDIGHGYRQIDLGTVFFVTSGAFDGEGRAEQTFDVPDDPALVSVTVHWQALIGAPLFWSNREDTTILDF